MMQDNMMLVLLLCMFMRDGGMDRNTMMMLFLFMMMQDGGCGIPGSDGCLC